MSLRLSMKLAMVASLAGFYLTLPMLAATSYTWVPTGSGSWNATANWNPNTAFPNAQDDVANFGTSITGPATVTANADTVGQITFNAGFNYTISSSVITMNSSTGTATITVSGGNTGAHTISSGLNLSSNAVVTNNTSPTFTLSGAITGAGSLTAAGGTLVLGSATNSYTGGTNLSAGTLNISSDGNLGGTSSTFTFAPSGTGTLGITAGITLNAARTINLAGDGIFAPTTATTTFSGLITGSGGLTKSGAGTLFLAGTNSYTGGTTISSGTLAIAKDINIGGSSGGILFNTGSTGTLALTGSNTIASSITLTGTANIGPSTSGVVATLSGVITGSGTLGFSMGAGSTFNLTGTNNSSGPIAITGAGAGTSILTIANAASFGSPSSLSLNGVQLVFNSSMTVPQPITLPPGSTTQGTFAAAAGATVTFSGVITGSSAFYGSNLNAGTLVLTGTNTYSGGLDTRGGSGAIQIFNDAALGTGPLTIRSNLKVSGTTTSSRTVGFSGNPSFTVDSGCIWTVTGVVGGSSGGGGFAKLGDGTLVLANAANTRAGFTQINAGTVSISSAGNLSASSSVIFPAAGTGTLQFSAPLTFAVPFTLTGNGIINAATGTSNLTGVITGAGSLTYNGSGTLVLSGTNTYTGGTIISAGTLKLASTGSLSSTGTVNLTASGAAFDVSGLSASSITVGNLIGISGSNVELGNKTLILNNSGDTTFSGVIGGIGGALTKQGSGTLTLSGMNTYTGDTTVSSGSFYVDGTSLSALTTIGSNALLGGNGTLQDVTILGELSPGHSIGTMHAASAIFSTGALYTVEVEGAAADLLITTGDITIASGTTLAVTATNPTDEFYTVLEAGGTLSGQFSNVTMPYARYRLSTYYSENKLILGIIGNVPFPDIIPSGDLHGIAVCFQEMVDSFLVDEQNVLKVLDSLTDAEIVDAFDQFNPGLFNSIAYAEETMARSFRQIYTERLFRRECSCDALPYRFWSTFVGDWSHQKSTNSTRAYSGYKDRFYGGLAGFDAEFKNDIWGSLGFAYAHNNLGWTQADAFAQVNDYTVSLAGAWMPSSFYVDAYVSYSYNSIDSSRRIYVEPELPPGDKIPVAPIDRLLRHKGSGNAYMGHLGVAYEIWNNPLQVYLFGVRPFVNVDYTLVHQSSFAEEGGGTLNMTVQGKNTDLLRPEIGLACHFTHKTRDNYTLFGEAAVSFAKEIRFSGRETDASFSDQRSCTFSVAGLFPQNNLVCPSFQLEVCTPCERVGLHMGYNGTFGSNYSENQVTAEVTIAW